MTEPDTRGCSTGACSGACCAVFTLSLSYAMFNPRMGESLSPENSQIAQMIVPLTKEEADARCDRLGYGHVRLEPGSGLFTCSNWDEETRLCGIYDERPRMCRAYPYDSRACERGCGYALSPEDRVAFGYDEPDEPKAPMEWVRDDEEDGWRAAFKSTPEFVWDEEQGILRRADQ